MKKKWVTRLRNKEDMKIAILCLMAASIFWFFHAMNDNYITNIEYPIEVRYDPSVIIKTGKIPKEINVNVSGYGWHLLRKQLFLRSKPCIIQVSNPNKQHYLTKYQLQNIIAKQLNSSNIKINQLDIDTFFLPFDWLVHKNVFLNLSEENLDSLYVVKNIEFSSDTIKINGPKKIVTTIDDTICVESKNINDAKENIFDIALKNYFPEEITLEDTIVNVFVELFEYKEQQLKLPIHILNTAQKDIIYHDSLSVYYQIREDSIPFLKSTDFNAIIHYQQKTEDDTYLIELIEQPSFIRFQKIIPTNIKLAK